MLYSYRHSICVILHAPQRPDECNIVIIIVIVIEILNISGLIVVTLVIFYIFPAFLQIVRDLYITS